MLRITILLHLTLVSAAVAQTNQSTWSLHERLNPLDNSVSPTAFAPESCNSNHFQLLCALPYDGRPQPIDASCGHCGESSLSGDKLRAEFAQNFLKNNLCSTSNAPTDVNVSDFSVLQNSVNGLTNFNYGNPHAGGFGPPLDRTPLQHLPRTNGKPLKEGVVVRYVGFMVEEHYSPMSPSSSGESVNCSDSDHPSVDIHIALSDDQVRLPAHATTQQKMKVLCPTITAEMIPHYRPDDWNYEELEIVADRKVRIIGQLFFDGSHRVCNDPARAETDPKRISSWEIHPVYSFEVCRRADGSCDIASDTDWEAVGKAVKEIEGESE